MDIMRMKVAKCPSDSLSLTNCAIVSPQDFDDSVKYIELQHISPDRHFIFTVTRSTSVSPGFIGFSLMQRKWANLSTGQDIDVRPFTIIATCHTITTIVLEADFFMKNRPTIEPYDTDGMAREFLAQFYHQCFSVGQQLAFSFQGKKMLTLVVKELEATDMTAMYAGGKEPKTAKALFGVCNPNTAIVFDRAEKSAINLTGKSKGKTARRSVINADWDFLNMGIGGLDEQFSAVFRRAFISRIFPPDLVKQCGLRHVKGILLYGRPGTGKTLIARKITKMLNAREPKIVNGPEVLDKFVGGSEANIRNLFYEAEEEEKRLGPNSGLHVIIFDEIDAICRPRGSVSSTSGVNDSIVTQLLSKLDGVEQLNNILVIGMTNRKDNIDEALLRPGRLEVQIEIGLPDEYGREQIFKIHTSRLKENGRLSPDVDLKELAKLTTNYTGAEIEGLVNAALSTAMDRLVSPTSKAEVDPEASDKLMLYREDFLYALNNDVKAALGNCDEKFEMYMSGGLINWGEAVEKVLDYGAFLTREVQNNSGLHTVLVEGPPCAGKTAIAARLAKNSGYPCIQICSSDDMVGLSETKKCLRICEIFENAYSSRLSCILVDEIERLLDYSDIGCRYSNVILQALRSLLKKEPPKGHKLLVICTTSRRDILNGLKVIGVFRKVLHVPNLSSLDQLMTVLEETGVSDKFQVEIVRRTIGSRRLSIGIKTLLWLIDDVLNTEEHSRVVYFVSLLESGGFFQAEKRNPCG